MKIRSGFVSNSSTSSFIVVGCRFENNQKLLDSITPDKMKDFEQEIENHNKTSKWQINSVLDLLDENIVRCYDSPDFVFGVRLGSVDYMDVIAGIDSIKATFKETEEMFEEYFGKDHRFKPISLYGIKAEC